MLPNMIRRSPPAMHVIFRGGWAVLVSARRNGATQAPLQVDQSRSRPCVGACQPELPQALARGRSANKTHVSGGFGRELLPGVV
jgi:hypothetical protein